MSDPKPTVRYQPCSEWEPDPDPTAGACATCGWLEEDHWLADLERRAEPLSV